MGETKTAATIPFVKDHSSMTVAELYDAWQSSRQDLVNYGFGRLYSYYFDTYLIKRFGERKVNSIPAGEYAAFVNGLSNIKGTRGQEISTASLKQIVRTFRMMFEYGKLEFELNDPSRKAMVANKDKAEKTVFTLDEAEKLRSAASPLDIHHICILMCLYTGITRGEICGLKWKDIDFDNKVLKIRQYTDARGSGGRKLNRDIPIPISIMEQLLPMRQMYQSEDYVLTCSSNPMDISVFRYHYINLLKKAGIKYRKFGTLRNTFAANCLENGMDIDELNRLLGNPNIEVTIRRYVGA